MNTVAAVLAILATAPDAQDTVPRGIVSGYVRSAATEQPIPGAEVQVLGMSLRAVTAEDGHFEIVAVPPGVYGVAVRAIGFAPLVQPQVIVGSGKPVTLTVLLTPQAITLRSIEVSASPSYFGSERPGLTAPGTLTAEETRRAPGVSEDVVRAVALLPGVAVTSAGRNDLIVRGGAPYENLFLVDDIEVPNVNHFGSQGSTGGPLSLLNVELVQQTDFAAGGFGVKYGDRTASLTSITLRDGNEERLAGLVNLSATGFGAIAEGPLGNRGSFFLGARRSYLDLLFRAAGFSFIPSYWDFQGKATFRLDARNQLSLLAIGALDDVAFLNDDADARYDNSRVLAPTQRQYFAGITWKHFLARGIVTTSLGRTYTRFETVQQDSLDPPQTVFSDLSREGENTLRSDVVFQPSPRTTVTVGADARYASDLRYQVTLSGAYRTDAAGVPQPLSVDTSFTAFRGAGYAEFEFAAMERVRLAAGARVNYYGTLDAWRTDPRVTARLGVTARTTLTLALGRYSQPPSYIWLVGDPSNAAVMQPIRADQALVGLQQELRPDARIRLETYYKRYTDYPARVYRPQAVLAPAGFEDVTTDIPFGLEPLVSQGTGRAWGVELFAQKKLSTSPWYGLASVSVARSEFTAQDGTTRPGAYDGRVIATVLAGWRPNRSWELSGKFRIATGLPTTPFVTTGPETGQLDFTQYNAGPRLPLFNALDLRADRRWSFRTVQLDVYLDVQNVYGRENVSGYQWNPRTGAPEAQTSLGVLPTLGVNVEF